MKRFLPSLLAAVLMLTACSGKPTVPESPAPPVSAPAPTSPEPAKPAPPTVTGPVPAIKVAEIRMGEDFPGGGSMLGERKLLPGESLVPSDDFVLFMELAPAPDAPWFWAVKLEGAKAEPMREEDFQHGWLQLQIKEGEPGTTATLTLPPVAGAQETVYRLKRVAPPTAKLDVEADGKWVPAQAHSVYPAAGLKLRLSFTAPMDRQMVEARVRRAGNEGVQVTWQDDRTLLAQWQQAPPVIWISLVGTQDLQGIYLIGPIPTVHTGPAPYLAAVNLTSGAERQVVHLMPEAYRAEVSTPGNRLLVQAWDRYGGQSGYTRLRPWLVDLQNGSIQSADGPAGTFPMLVRNSGALQTVPYQSDARKAYYLGPFSPEGARRIAFARPATAPESGQWFSAGLEVLTADGAPQQKLTGEVRVLAGKYGSGQPQAAWSPDGKQVVVTSDVDQAQTDLMLVDLVAGTMRRVATVPRFSSFYVEGVTIQWEGRRVLAGRNVVDLDSGKIIFTLQSGSLAAQWLSPDGRHLLHATGDATWGPVAITALDSGSTVNNGEGMPAGWLASGEALIIRWQGYPQRYVLQGL